MPSRRSRPRAAALLLTILTCLLPLAAAADDDAPRLEIKKVLGDEESPIFLHGPGPVIFAPGGDAYVLNAGESTIVRLDADWEEVGRFGAKGQGPGEFENPTGMLLHDGLIWVFETSRITRYDLDGAYVDFLKTGLQMSDPVLVGGRIHVVMGAGADLLAVLDDQGKPVERLGPSCPADDFMERFRACSQIQVLPWTGGLGVVLNRFTGKALMLDADGRKSAERSLVETGDYTETSEEDGEQTHVSLSMTLNLGYGCLDAQGRYLVPIYPPDGDEDDPVVLAAFDAEMSELWRMLLPEDVTPYRIFAAPSGELLLVSDQGSTIHVAELVED